jgi:hypothetical protein
VNSGAPRASDSTPGQTGGGQTDNSGFLLGDDGKAVDTNGIPLNIGTETKCDGIDENNNGIVDDVDVGHDGLCDCLHIGFFGALASDAGNKTGAFEAWLNARSSVPVVTIQAQTTITADVLNGLQVLVVGNLGARKNNAGGGFAQAELDAIYKWVNESGGGVITLAGYTANETDVVPTVTLLGPFGMSYDYKGRGPGVDGTGAPPVIANHILAPAHPTLDGIQAVGVYNAYPVTGDGQPLIGDGTNVLAMAKEVGMGHVYVFSDEWITQDALWQPNAARPLTQCEQQCNQCKQQCANCDTQCQNCQMQPCEGGQQQVPDGGTCRRGCDQGCSSCTTNCTTCEAACNTCSAAEGNTQLDIPRFWLEIFRWLTPSNECQVPLPTETVR